MKEDILIFIIISIFTHIHSYLCIFPYINESDFSISRYNLIHFTIIGPIVEEILFRYALTNFLLNHFGNIGHIIAINSIIFGLAHFDNIYQVDKKYKNIIFVQILRSTLLGIILECIYLRHDNLYLVIVLHMLFNTSVLSFFKYYDSQNCNLKNVANSMKKEYKCVGHSKLKRNQSFDEYDGFRKHGSRMKIVDTKKIKKKYEKYLLGTDHKFNKYFKLINLCDND